MSKTERTHRINMLIYRKGQPTYKVKSKSYYEKKLHGNLSLIMDGMLQRMITAANDSTKARVGHWTHIEFRDNHSNEYPQPLLRRYTYDFGRPLLIYPKAQGHETGSYQKTGVLDSKRF